MNHKIKISNFKCFNKSEFNEVEFSNLTICSGMNSVGKSTLIQTLLLLRQSAELYKKPYGKKNNVNILLNTSALHLGSTEQIMSDREPMYLELDGVGFTYRANTDKLSLHVVAFDRNDANKDKTTAALNLLFKKNFYYLNAERLGPRNYQKITSFNTLNNCCGINGEYTFDVIASNFGCEVAENRRFLYDNSKRNPDLEKQIEYWLAYIANGVQVQFSHDLFSQTAHMRVNQPDSGTQFASPYNFGFGISYVLPIITTCLFAQANSTIIIENPEAHLHPEGQSRMGRFLAQVSQDGLNVIVETHSEHIINGARIYALKNNISPEEICINNFSINENGEHRVERLTLNDKMEIQKWPDGFLDQEEKDLSELRRLRRSNNGE